ncbi:MULTISPECIES: lytic transglycosylase domain-containing protein [Comamonas]|uniref:lytic transglycosylase domain-containing protein n=1 Tax=Comamonas TaxID=283 RepID=UPI0015FD6508|nr:MULTISPECIES: lytic transglycosylase domain-containing protein [Comamonas]UUC92147.1 lytic transglycosylase domain-containing protein [Comamonas sp. C11]WEE76178.1 lytic transglycosylase domain-containing protein [Comamonas testosteroni]
MPASGKLIASARTLGHKTAHGFLALTHNGFALLGLAVAISALILISRPDLRLAGATELREWLDTRLPASTVVAAADVEEAPASASIVVASDRATAVNPKNLPKEQAAVAYWLSKKYRVAPEPIAALVSEAYAQGKANKLDPTLILAIMAIESSFNPFAQSSVGAQGLMQVMTSVHTDKYESFGGQHAAFDPVTNLKVGVKVLKECIARAGSIEGGLRYYVGAANLPSDGGYAAKVLAEHQRLRQGVGLQASPLMTAKSDEATKVSHAQQVALANSNL